MSVSHNVIYNARSDRVLLYLLTDQVQILNKNISKEVALLQNLTVVVGDFESVRGKRP